MRGNPQRVTEGATCLIHVSKLKVADAEPLQGTVVVGVQRERTLAVQDRLLKLTCLPQNGSTTIPAFREFRMLRRDLIENAKRFFEILTIRRLTRLLHHPIDLAAGC